MREATPSIAGTRALVLGSARQSLVACRDLASAGVEVHVARRESEHDFVLGSRAVRSVSVVPDPQQDTDGFADGIERLVSRTGAQVVLPAGDSSLAALSATRGRLPASVPLAAHETIVTVLDKIEIAPIARDAGLPVPETKPATDELVATWSGPAVVKDRSHWNPGAGAASHRAAIRSEDRAELADAVARLRAEGGRPVVQPLAPGRMICFSAFRDRTGAVSGRTQQTSDHLWPVPFGTTSRSTSTEIDPGVAERVAVLLDRLDWIGWINLQLFHHSDVGSTLIDVNGRFNHSMALAEAAGVRPAQAWMRLGLGRDEVRLPDARPGVRLSLTVPDLKRARRERRGGALRDLANTAAFALTAHHTIPRASDPVPALRYLARAWRGR